MPDAADPGAVERVREALAGAGYAAGWAVAGRLPAGVVEWVSDAAADLATRRDGPGVRRLRQNLARVRPGATPAELDDLVARGMRSYARYWREAFALPSLDPDAVHDAMHPHVHGIGPSLETLRAGRGVLYALPHSGNWDVAGVYMVRELARLGLEPAITTVVQRLRPESLFRRFLDYRHSLGFEVVTADDPRTAHRALTARLRSGGVVCLVADRDLSGTGVEVSFLGRPARLPAGPARLARATGAALHPAYAVFAGDAWGVHVGPEIPVPDRAAEAKAVQALADAFGELIARRPEDWHMLQPIRGVRA
ncbi:MULTISPECIES: phosphatidylinositol mannoside acyltransferase [unclassified Pseudonocardia]|uniref:phosphatidylinositol mannoside acyltransferase n=1 Tax=unclassified Pseudonocardia TaxID=2619320 RepID=UPI00094B738E|nr:phosphatidylinositol mannoside acyltransferase [Pseudonocardia sp. Ae707_Ps1]OLM19177.1 Lauroyl/myristoyl acyltransferase involved in lipid A biosynthesis [Pseudonocardia sp. Ae707_Ps1]